MLGVLFRHGTQTLTQLAERERVSAPSMNRTVNCLEETGYLQRVADDVDRRKANITLTEAGRELVKATISKRDAWLTVRLRELSEGGSRRARARRRADGRTRHPVSAMFRSLASRDYRIWFIGALVSNIGAWMQATAQNWVVLTELTDTDALAVGITMALQFAPQLLLVPITGLIADRFDRRKILMVTQTSLMVLGLALGLLLILGHAELWHLYGFALRSAS